MAKIMSLDSHYLPLLFSTAAMQLHNLHRYTILESRNNNKKQSIFPRAGYHKYTTKKQQEIKSTKPLIKADKYVQDDE